MTAHLVVHMALWLAGPVAMQTALKNRLALTG